MFAQMERTYMLERGAGARAAKHARGLPTGRPAKLNATTRARAAQRIRTARSPNRPPLTSASAAPRCAGSYARNREGASQNRSDGKADQRSRSHPCRSATFVAFLAIATAIPGQHPR